MRNEQEPGLLQPFVAYATKGCDCRGVLREMPGEYPVFPCVEKWLCRSRRPFNHSAVKDHKAVEWLSGQLPGLVESGVLTPETAEALRAHYRKADDPGHTQRLAVIVCAILGGTLIGARAADVMLLGPEEGAVDEALKRLFEVDGHDVVILAGGLGLGQAAGLHHGVAVGLQHQAVLLENVEVVVYDQDCLRFAHGYTKTSLAV